MAWQDFKILRSLLVQIALIPLIPLTAFAQPAQSAQSAQSAQAVKLVVGYAAGGPVDAAARLFAPAFARELGQPSGGAAKLTGGAA